MSSQLSFLLLFRDTAPEKYERLSDEERRQSLERWNAWYDGIAARGQMDHGHPLGAARRLVTSGRVELFDGPFSEAKEAIGGYFLVTVRDIEEATEIARACPNLEYGMTVEVRPVVTMCHLAKDLGMTSMRS